MINRKLTFAGVLLAFALASCGDGGGGSGGTPPLSIPAGSGGTPANPVLPIYLGNTLAIPAQAQQAQQAPQAPQVYTASRTAPNLIYSFTPYTGSHKVYNGYYDEVTDNYVSVEEIGTTMNGRLSFTIGIPGRLLPLDASFGNDYWDNINVSGNDVKYFPLKIYARAEDFLSLGMRNMTTSVNGKAYVDFEEFVDYIYVDKDVTVTGKGKTGTETNEYGKTTYKVSDLNLALKTGWNAIYTKEVDSGTFSGTSYFDLSNTYNSTYTYTAFLSNPSLRWVMGYYISSQTTDRVLQIVEAASSARGARFRMR